MPRKPRFFVPNFAAHVVQRGNNRCPTFQNTSDYSRYLESLGDAARTADVSVHAYVLMTNHIHLLLTPCDSEGISRMMQNLGRDYVAYFNRKYGRTGTLWDGRFKACPVESERYTLACYRYIEMNPVRAGMVRRPGDYPWSSYGHNAVTQGYKLITPHPVWLGLGETLATRQAAYRSLFEQDLTESQLVRIRECLQSGTPFGSQQFTVRVERELTTCVGQIHRGRPAKKGSDPLLEKGSDPF